jgi:hypothetical protein
MLAGRRIACEGHARAGAVALVAEDHLDDVHRGAEVVGNVVRAAVDLGAWRLPRVEHCPERARQLLAGVLRERAARLLLVDVFERRDELAQVVGRQLDVLRDPARFLQVAQRVLEAVRVDPVHDLAVLLDQAPVRVVREARILGRAREPVDRGVVQAEVQDRVHHPGHRDGRARADGDEQRVARVAEPLAGLLLERGEMLFDFAVQPIGQPFARRHVRAARVGGDREARGNRGAERCHLRQPGAFTAEQLLASG